MKTHDAPKRSPGEPGDLGIHGRPAPYQTGVLPKDFVQRLNRLKKAGGLTWNGFAQALRVDRSRCPGGVADKGFRGPWHRGLPPAIQIGGQR